MKKQRTDAGSREMSAPMKTEQLIGQLRRDCILKLLILTLLAAAIWLALPASGHLVFSAEAVPVRLEIPVQYETEEEGQGTVVTLRAEDPSAPMPEGSAGGVCQRHFSGSGCASLGTIACAHPGVYEYSIFSDTDPSVYHLRAIATSDGQGSLIIRREGAEGKTALVFRQKAGEDGCAEESAGTDPSVHPASAAADARLTDTDTGPQTGDRAPLVLWLALSILSGTCFLLLLAASGRTDRDSSSRRGGSVRRPPVSSSHRGGSVRRPPDRPSGGPASGGDRRRGRYARMTSLCMAVMLCLLSMPEDCAGAGMKVTLHRYGSCTHCSLKRGDDRNSWKRLSYDDGAGATTYRWVTYTDPGTGKKKKADAYCLQPTKGSPGTGTRTAALLDPSKAGKQQKLSRLLYFANGGPGNSALKKYLRDHRAAYPAFQSEQGQYTMMHILLAYGADPDHAFDVTSTSGDPAKAEKGQLSKNFQKKIKAIYSWCQKNAVILEETEFSIRPAEAEAVFDSAAGCYWSEELQVTGGDPRQYFRFKVPVQAEMTVTHGEEEETWTAGETAEVHVGDSFRFRFEEGRSGGIVKTRVSGVHTALLPYRIRSAGNQDMGFYAGRTSAAAAFAVRLKEDTGSNEEANEAPDGEPGNEPGEAPGGEPGDEADVDPENTEHLRETCVLEIRKTVQAAAAEAGRSFAYHAVFTGLTGEGYLAVLPGAAMARIESNAAGDLTVELRGSTWAAGRQGDLRGIPVKVIRSDGASRTLRTDRNGSIPASAYADWLREAEEDHRYTIEFLRESWQETW